MTSPVFETVAQIADRERKKAIRLRDDTAAVVAALVQAWAQHMDRKGGGPNSS